MLLYRPCRSCYEILPMSVDAEFVNIFRGQSWYVGFLSRCIIFTECSLPWQHFRWSNKQMNIDITVKFLLVTLWRNLLVIRNISKVAYACLHVADWRRTFFSTATYLSHCQRHISYSSRTTSCSIIVYLLRFSPRLTVAQDATYMSAMMMDIWIDHACVTKTYRRQLLSNLQIDTNVAPIRVRIHCVHRYSNIITRF